MSEEFFSDGKRPIHYFAIVYDEDTGDIIRIKEARDENIPTPFVYCKKEDWFAIAEIGPNKIVNGVPALVKTPLTSQEIRDRNIKRRVAAYKQESDPLYMEWQYDKTTEKEDAWRAKVSEIKERYPI